MLQPSYSQIMQKLNAEAEETVVTSRYSVVIATARRARQIIDLVNQANDPKAEKNGETLDAAQMKEASELNIMLRRKKPTSIAVDEIYSGKIKMKEQIIEG